MSSAAKIAWARPRRVALGSAGALTAAGWVLGAVVTLLIVFVPQITFGFHTESGHLIFDSVDACVAALVAYLVYGRFVRYRRLQDVLLWQGLALLAVAGLGLTYLTEAITGSDARLDVWLPLTVRIIGALLITVAALSGDHPPPSRPFLKVLPLLATAAAVVVMWAVRDHLPRALDEGQQPPSANHPYFAGHTALLLAQAATAALFFVASVAFARRASGQADELLRWLGPGCALAGFARVNYLLYPSLYTDWFYTGDLLRTGCYLLLLIGASREIRQFWDARTRALLSAERHRLAAELHDGVIQELGLIRAESFSLPEDSDARKVILRASERGLDEARAAVHVLAHAEDESLEVLVRRAAIEVGERHGVAVELAADDAVTADPEQRHGLIRIVREAVSNAARHGRAKRVHVHIRQVDGRRQIAIRDDGDGFDLDAAEESTGYGLIGMRERALVLPGSLHITSTVGEGTVVTVTW